MYTLHTQYKADIESFPLSTERVGVFKPGRYCGFDTMLTRAGVGDIPIKITHAASGMVPTTNENVAGPIRGSVITPHGTILETSDESNLALSANSSSHPRIDVLYLQFSWVDDEVAGVPFVSILQGTAGATPVEPDLASPEIQIKLGTFLLEGNTSTISGVTYTPKPVPLLGGVNIFENFPELDERYARLDVPNRFMASQYLRWVEVDLTLESGNLLLPKTGNTFTVWGDGSNVTIGGIMFDGLEKCPVGTEFTILFKDLGDNSYLDSHDNEGDQAFWLSPIDNVIGLNNDDFALIPIKSEDIVTFKYRGVVSSKDIWQVTCPTSYIVRNLYRHEKSLEGLLNPVANWVTMGEYGAGVYAFASANFTAGSFGANAFAYRKNKQGQLEFKGGFFTAYTSSGIIKLGTIDPAYLNNISPLIFFIKNDTGVVTTVAAQIRLDGSIYLASIGPGIYYCNSVISAI